MIILVLADNMIFMYIGWEGVGICSYLLISFYRSENKNINAANKAFFMTRLGDIFLLVSMICIYSQVGSLKFQDINIYYESMHPYVLFLIIGAAGKSAQIPLQTWLKDAMAGPTPASALIHAATMVTAGVYLLVRTNCILESAPNV